MVEPRNVGSEMQHDFSKESYTDIALARFDAPPAAFTIKIMTYFKRSKCRSAILQRLSTKDKLCTWGVLAECRTVDLKASVSYGIFDQPTSLPALADSSPDLLTLVYPLRQPPTALFLAFHHYPLRQRPPTITLCPRRPLSDAGEPVRPLPDLRRALSAPPWSIPTLYDHFPTPYSHFRRRTTSLLSIPTISDDV
ncbi:hypothetical protein RHGRI_024340 [Rhododendron griersonianum]|uniref:Uncharacterized protein n=1 Tax=Rhododendron griersonianum TaxID=479676 RepID=A0AAV6J824_9ERIC|nr:hypothetical protein RHGRI_024340 [Rhododendron griersonianum]